MSKMTLKKYRSKRDFTTSPEPIGNASSPATSLRFCVQKHAARRLHYDFRLEYKGVLLSWAVPKGPSTDPKDKRLAVKVEDHPLDYQYFEGTIPKGHYGAGTVEIWDNGTYTVPNADTRRAAEKHLAEGLEKGHFSIVLSGDKLKGLFVLQKLRKDPADSNWLLIKQSDPFTSSEAIIEEIPSSMKGEQKSKMLPFFAPMLATLVDKPFTDQNWLFEVKWDGFRALAFIEKKKVQLKSRKNHLLNEQFIPIVQDLLKIDQNLILDGELVVLDESGKSHFQLMQNYQTEKKGDLYYYVFDLLYKDGEDLRNLPLLQRKELLKKLLSTASLPLIRYSDHLIGAGEDFFAEATKQQLEGIIGKKIDSSYQSKRSLDWVKIKTSCRQETVIGGFTAPRGSRKKFGALLVGVFNDKNELVYSGHVGGGFNRKLLQEVFDQLQPLIQDQSPFKGKPPKANAAVTWVRPKLICEVSFSEWTGDKIMRHPVFQGLRTDKVPNSVKREIPKKTDEAVENPNQLTLTNLDKIYWPKEGYTKGNLIEYYQKVSSFILPYLKDRPIVLHRFPNGIEGKEFYHKDINFPHPDWIKTVPVQSEDKTINHLIINDLRSLLYAINLGSIDLHPFLSRYPNLLAPDYCVIDLDPRDISFKYVVEAAQVIHNLLEKIEVPHFCKTSGGKGLHILIPFHGRYDFEQSKQFAEMIVLQANQKLPRTTSVERSPQKRAKKIYLDFLQNRQGQTIAAPYTVRPRPFAQVSTPLEWDEVNEELDPQNFNIETVPKRLEEKGEIFKRVLGAGINLKKVLKNFL